MGETDPSQDTIDAAPQPDLTDADAEHTTFDLGLSRRGLLISGGLLGLLGLGSGGASADASGQIGTTSDPLTQLHTEALNGASLPDFTNATTGQILAFDANNDLTLAANGGDVSELTTSNFVGLQVVDGGTTVSSESDGNKSANIIGSHPANEITRGEGSVVFGGEGGSENSLGGDFAAILSGRGHTVENNGNVVVGGIDNKAQGGAPSVVGGGQSNTASGMFSTVPGGESNTASGLHSFAVGKGAKATKDGSFVFGDSSSSNVTANAVNEVRFQAGGGFVIEGTNTLQVEDGLPSGTGSKIGIDNSGNLVDVDASSARYKTNIRQITTDTSGVLNLQPTAYEYKETGKPDTGLIAEEVDEALPEIVHYDEEGRPKGVRYDRVGMFLAPEVSENRDRLEAVEAARDICEETIETLEVELEVKDARLADQADRIDQLAAENAQLADRLTRLEGQLGTDGAVTGTTPADD